MHLLGSKPEPAEEMWEKRLPPERVLPFDRKDAWGSASEAFLSKEEDGCLTVHWRDDTWAKTRFITSCGPVLTLPMPTLATALSAQGAATTTEEEKEGVFFRSFFLVLGARV